MMNIVLEGNMCKISKFLIVFLACWVATISNAHSTDETLLYGLQFKYPLNIPFKYSCVEKSQVNRKVVGGEDFEFKRDVASVFTFVMANIPSDGFQKIKVKMDSINHTIITKEKTKHFETMGGDLIKNWNDDLEQYNIPLSRSFTYIISPYYEFADLQPDEELKRVRAEVAEGANTMKKSDYVLWTNSLSNERYYHLTDLKKIELPAGKIAKDSIWISPIEFQVSGVTFFDSVRVRFVEERGGYLFLESKFSINKFSKEPVIVYGYRNSVSTPVEAELECKFNLTISPFHTVDDASLTANGSIKFKTDDSIEFVDSIDTKYQWKFYGRYNY